MKNVLIALFAAVVGLGLAVGDAEAKRLGGGKSFGMQRSVPAAPAKPAPAAAPTKPAPAAAPAQPAAQPAAAGGSRWLAPIAGLAAGLGLAALLSHLGLGEEVASIILILLLLLAALFLMRLLARRRLPESQPLQYAGAGHAPAPVSFEAPASGAAGAPDGSIPAGFDVEGFLRQAKLNFVRLQAAHDSGNVEDIRNFTTPEVFAEIRLQLAERGGAAQHTDVVTLNAHLLGLAEEGPQYVASVRFSGTLREAAEAAPEAFDEIWHLVKPVDGSRGWVVAGIQQAN